MYKIFRIPGRKQGLPRQLLSPCSMLSSEKHITFFVSKEGLFTFKKKKLWVYLIMQVGHAYLGLCHIYWKISMINIKSIIKMSLLKYLERSNGTLAVVICMALQKLCAYSFIKKFIIFNFQTKTNSLQKVSFHNKYQSWVWLKHEFQLFWNMLNFLNIISTISLAIDLKHVFQIHWNLFYHVLFIDNFSMATSTRAGNLKHDFTYWT